MRQQLTLTILFLRLLFDCGNPYCTLCHPVAPAATGRIA
jgi:hypothetical protein